MRRLLVAMAATTLSLSLGSVARAQEDTTPTTLDVETSVVEDTRVVTTVDSEEVDTDDDDDSDKTGLWGLLGLLGLAGLAGLKRKRDDYSTGTTRPVTGTAPKTADGATGTGTNP